MIGFLHSIVLINNETRSHVQRKIHYTEKLLARLYDHDYQAILIQCGDIETNPGPNLSMCHFNAQSLALYGTGSHVGDKANHKLVEAHTRLAIDKNFDIISVSETSFNNSITDESVNIPGYSLLRKDRICDHRSGGVCAYVKENLPVKRRHDLESNIIETMWIEIVLKPKSMFVGICYRPPGQNRNDAKMFIENLQEQVTII